jgi:DNA-binding MarR family transcriptional regulator
LETIDDGQRSRIEIVLDITQTLFRYTNKLLEEQHLKRNEKLNNTKLNILYMLYRNEPCMAVDIARQLNLTSGATTITLNQMEEDGFITRLRSEEDRRIVWLSLSEEGRRVAGRYLEFRTQLTQDLMGILTEKEQEDFFRLIQKIEQRMNERLMG